MPQCAAFAEELRQSQTLGTLGVSVVLPDGWQGDVQHKDPKVEGKGYNTVLKATCVTEHCKISSQEACSLWVYDEVSSYKDMDGLKTSYLGKAKEQYNFTRTALKSSGPEARVSKPIGIVSFGKNLWYRVETRAAAGYKSVLRADTVIDGRRIIAECRTCDRDDDNFETAHALLASVKIAP